MSSAEPVPESSSDAALVQLVAKQQDEAALQVLVEKYSRLIFSVCRQILGNQADAEDAFQNTIITFVRDAGKIKEPQYVSSWLYRVAQREAYDLNRKRSRLPQESLPEENMVSQKSEAEADANEELLILHEELGQIPEKYRSPLILCYLEGKSREQAATELEITLGSVKASLSFGRELLRKRLLQRGIALTAVLATWETSQAVSATGLSSALVHSAISNSLTGSVTTAGTTSLSTSITGSKGLLTKGMMWMAVSNTNKVLIGFVGAALLLGGITATSFLNLKERENNTTAELNQKKDDPAKETPQHFTEQDMKDLIRHIKKKEKLYENFEINLTLKTEQFGEKIDPINGGPINPGERLKIEDPDAIGITGNGTRLLKSSELTMNRVSQNGMHRGDFHRKFLFSNIKKEDDGHYYQWFENGETTYKESFDGEKFYREKEPTTYFSSAKMNPFHLFFMYKPEGRFTFLDLVEGKKQFEQTIMKYEDGKRSAHTYNLKAEIESRDFTGEDDLIIVKIQPVTEDEQLRDLQRSSLQFHKLYLSVKHNLIPVRVERYVVRNGFPPEENEEPYTVYEVNSWIEPEPDVWYPHQTVEYDRPLSPSNPTYKKTATYEVISLNPQYPVEYFQVKTRKSSTEENSNR